MTRAQDVIVPVPVWALDYVLTHGVFVLDDAPAEAYYCTRLSAALTALRSALVRPEAPQ